MNAPASPFALRPEGKPLPPAFAQQLADRFGARLSTAAAVREHVLDERDAGRSAAPLVAAPDAARLDTTDLDVERAVAAAVAIVERGKSRVQ